MADKLFNFNVDKDTRTALVTILTNGSLIDEYRETQWETDDLSDIMSAFENRLAALDAYTRHELVLTTRARKW